MLTKNGLCIYWVCMLVKVGRARTRGTPKLFESTIWRSSKTVHFMLHCVPTKDDTLVASSSKRGWTLHLLAYPKMCQKYLKSYGLPLDMWFLSLASWRCFEGENMIWHCVSATSGMVLTGVLACTCCCWSGGASLFWFRTYSIFEEFTFV